MENSLAALLTAAPAGLDGIECDLRCSLDGATVIAHDADLRRTHDLPIAIREETASDLSLLGIPTLDAFLAAAPQELFLDLELKEPPAESFFAAVRAARGAAGERLVISSFDTTALAAVRERAPGWALWLNVDGSIDGAVERAIATGCCGIAVDVALCDSTLLRVAESEGLEVAIWTLRSATELGRLSIDGPWPLVAACVEGGAALPAF